MMKKREIGTSIILSIVTCGLYSLYWMCCVTDEINCATEEDSPSGLLALVLTIVTCGLYGYYWAYVMGKRVNRLKEIKRGNSISDDSNPILYLIVYFLLGSIIPCALIQSELNKFYDFKNEQKI